MKRIIITFGLIAAAIIALWVIIMIPLGNCTNMEYGMLYGYTAMLISFSMIYVAIKTFRDKHNGGAISFGKAFKIGLSIALIASTSYVVVWLVEYYFFIPDFYDKYAAHVIKGMQAKGAALADIEATKIKIAQYKEWARNPFINAAMTYMEILPVGILVSLITAGILKRRPVNTI